MKKALILDLDNTIYPVSAIADNLFAKLFTLLDEYTHLIGGVNRVNKIKDEMTRRPFQHIADEFELNNELRYRMIKVLSNMTYDLPMQPFEDYRYIRSIPLDKFLVTTGFVKLQMSKVKMLAIIDDFKQIHIVDPEVNTDTKKDVFKKIMKEQGYKPGELLIIGDDPNSEIKAARELGIDSFLFDPMGKHPDVIVTHKSSTLKDVLAVLGAGN